MGNIESSDIDTDGVNEGRFVIHFQDAENIPASDSVLPNQVYLRAFISENAVGEDDQSSAPRRRVTDFVQTPRRTFSPSIRWDAYRDFRINPNPGSFLTVEILDWNDHDKKVDKEPLIRVDIPVENFNDEEDKYGQLSNFRIKLKRVYIDRPAPLRKTIFLIRHGESKWNQAQEKGNLAGMLLDRDHPLTTKGIDQASELRDKWMEYQEELTRKSFRQEHFENWNDDTGNFGNLSETDVAGVLNDPKLADCTKVVDVDANDIASSLSFQLSTSPPKDGLLSFSVSPAMNDSNLLSSGHPPRRSMIPEVPQRLRFLIVDYIMSDRKALKHMLERDLGYQVDEASNGAEAVEMVEKAALARTPFDCIIIDCAMPAMDVPATAREIRAMGFQGVIAGLGPEVEVRETDVFTVDSGVVMVFEKPLTQQGVEQIVEQLDKRVSAAGADDNKSVPPSSSSGPSPGSGREEDDETEKGQMDKEMGGEVDKEEKEKVMQVDDSSPSKATAAAAADGIPTEGNDVGSEHNLDALVASTSASTSYGELNTTQQPLESTPGEVDKGNEVEANVPTPGGPISGGPILGGPTLVAIGIGEASPTDSEAGLSPPSRDIKRISSRMKLSTRSMDELASSSAATAVADDDSSDANCTEDDAFGVDDDDETEDENQSTRNVVQKKRMAMKSVRYQSLFPQSASLDEINQRRHEYMRLFLEADQVYSSPFTRAIETAYVSLWGHPALEKNCLTLYSVMREFKGVGGLDSIGQAHGEQISGRVAAELEMKLGSEVVKEMLVDGIDVNDAANVWWTNISSFDTKADQTERIEEFISYMRYMPSRTPIFVGHSLFFKLFYSKRVSDFLKGNRPELTENLQKYRLGNATLLAVSVEFAPDSDTYLEILDADVLFGGGFHGTHSPKAGRAGIEEDGVGAGGAPATPFAGLSRIFSSLTNDRRKSNDAGRLAMGMDEEEDEEGGQKPRRLSRVQFAPKENIFSEMANGVTNGLANIFKGER